MSSIPSEKLFMMKEGSQVEIFYKDDGFEDVWYKGIIEAAKPESRIGERCVRLLKDDSLTLLTQLADKAWFRPSSPKDLEARMEIKEGSIVDADFEGSWWTGLVFSRIEDDKCLVLFDSPPDLRQFERKHLEWVDGKWCERPRRNLQEESMFSPGTMVEASAWIKKTEPVWFPAVIIKEIKENDKTKYIVKACKHHLGCKVIEARGNVTVDMRCVRPRPPSVSVEEYQSMEYVEVFHATCWRQGRVTEIHPRKRYTVRLEATNLKFTTNLSDIRPSKVWKDGVWKSREPSLAQGSVNKMCDSMMNAKEYGPPVTSSPGITATKADKTLPRDHNGLGNDSTRHKNEDNIRKRKRDLTSVAITEENEANNTTMVVLPFRKTLPIWKTFESMDVFKMFPQSPHFIPLLEIREDRREFSAAGMMLTFSSLLEVINDLQHKDVLTSLTIINQCFSMLKKHGFDVKVYEFRISKLSSLRDRQAKIMEELKGAQRVTAEKESVKVEIEHKILKLQRLNEEVEKEIAQSKSCEERISQQLEDVKLQYQATASAPW